MKTAKATGYHLLLFIPFYISSIIYIIKIEPNESFKLREIQESLREIRRHMRKHQKKIQRNKNMAQKKEEYFSILIKKGVTLHPKI